MHILLTRFSSMGDVVLTTATINWLHSLLGKELVISFVTSQEFTSLLDGHPGVRNVIGFDRRKGEKWKDLVKKIDQLDEKEPIDLIMDLHATMRSLRLRFSFWTIPALTVDKRRWERFFLTKIRSTKLKSIFSRKFFGLEPQVVRVLKDFESIFADTRSERRTEDFVRGPNGELTTLQKKTLPEMKRPYVVLAPSASFAAKRWPISSFVQLGEELLKTTEYDIVVLAGKDDSFCEAFSQIQNDRLHNLQGKTSLSESMSYLQGAKLSIGNDSGMNHIAEAYGVPVVTIFGPTDPKFGFSSHGKLSVTLSKELWCKPCSTTGKKDCFRDRHYCMEEIKVQEVLEASMKSLEKK